MWEQSEGEGQRQEEKLEIKEESEEVGKGDEKPTHGQAGYQSYKGVL